MIKNFKSDRESFVTISTVPRSQWYNPWSEVTAYVTSWSVRTPPFCRAGEASRVCVTRCDRSTPAPPCESAESGLCASRKRMVPLLKRNCKPELVKTKRFPPIFSGSTFKTFCCRCELTHASITRAISACDNHTAHAHWPAKRSFQTQWPTKSYYLEQLWLSFFLSHCPAKMHLNNWDQPWAEMSLPSDKQERESIKAIISKARSWSYRYCHVLFFLPTTTAAPIEAAEIEQAFEHERRHQLQFWKRIPLMFSLQLSNFGFWKEFKMADYKWR